jgi:RNA polymerase sigma-70 factor (ECF subfamily)
MLVCDPSNARVTELHQSDLRSDHELVDALNDGEAAAFDVLYQRHCDWVASQAFRFTRDRDTALDVLQETFLYLTRKFPGFVLTCRLRTFLYPVVRNLSISALRRADRVTSLEALREAGQVTEPMTGPAEVPEDDELTSAVRALSPDHQEVLRLRFVEGFELAEIARGWRYRPVPSNPDCTTR